MNRLKLLWLYFKARKGMSMQDWMGLLKGGLAFLAGEDGAALSRSVENIAGKVENIARLVKEVARETREDIIPRARSVYEKMKPKEEVK